MTRRDEDGNVARVVAEIDARAIFVGLGIIPDPQLGSDSIERTDIGLDELASLYLQLYLVLLRILAHREKIGRIGQGQSAHAIKDGKKIGRAGEGDARRNRRDADRKIVIIRGVGRTSALAYD